MERLTERDGKQILYRKDGETFPYPLMSHYDICRVLERLAELEDKEEPQKPDVVTIRNVDYPKCPNCGRYLWGKEFYCATCGKAIDRSEI